MSSRAYNVLAAGRHLLFIVVRRAPQDEARTAECWPTMTATTRVEATVESTFASGSVRQDSSSWTLCYEGLVETWSGWAMSS